MNKHLLGFVLVAGCSSAAPSATTLPRNAAAASSSQLARAYIAQRSPDRDASCFAYVDEIDSDGAPVIAVREVHDDACGGDPGVEPVIARLRVHPAGMLERYDVVDDEWHPIP
jgi:hypothetical protein